MTSLRSVLAFAAVLGAASTASAQGQSCSYEGSVYSDGALSCQRGTQSQCMNGSWVEQGETCTPQYGGAAGQMGMESGAENPQGTDAFMPGDSQVAPSDPNPGDY